jgi:hypothetical protein
MSEVELATLKDYINKNLKKGFIQKSTSKARALVLFMPKKDRKL